MKRIIRYGILCILIFAFLLCVKAGKSSSMFFAESGSYQALSGVDGILRSGFDRMKNDYEYIAGAYSEYEDQSIENAFGRTAEVTVLYKDFDSNCLFDSFNVLYADDPYGCLLDSDTMYGMFGTSLEVGQTVSYDGKNYIVRGVIEEDVSIMVVNYPGMSSDDIIDEPIGGILLDTTSETYKGQYSAKIEASYGEADACFYVDEYKSLARWTDSPVKWSDFGFWSDYMGELSERIHHMFYDDKDITERMCMMKGCRYVGRGVLAVVLLVMCLLLMRAAARRDIFDKH